MSKRQKRIAVITADYDESKLQLSIEHVITSQSNDALFTIDTIGKKRVNKLEKTVTNEEKTFFSISEKKLLRKLKAKKPISTEISYKKDDLKDIWGTVDIPIQKIRTHTPATTNNIMQIIPGQSYNPSHRDHQDLLAEAVALEIIKADSFCNKPVDHSTVLQSQSVLEVEENSLQGDDDDSHNTPEPLSQKKPKQVTRAKKNRRKRATLALREKTQADLNKKILDAIDQLPRILKDLSAEEKLRSGRQAEMAAKKRKLDEGLSYEQVAEVPLSDELKGNLRQLRPKGSLLSGSLEQLRSVGRATKRKLPGQAKRHDKPHAGKNIVWHAKYKY